MRALTRGETRTRDDVTDLLTGFAAAAAPARTGAGVERAGVLLDMLGQPQDRFRAVHVAGSAGKGSVTAFVASLLGAHGFNVGAHLSPHVRSVLERFQLNGRAAAPGLVRRELAGLGAAARAMARTPQGRPTYFEIATVLAFLLFAHRRVDYGVIETGIGGRLDATNTMSRPDKLAVLTAIGRDHTQVLGESLGAIAAQKAGIFPAHGEAVAIVSGTAEVNRVLIDVAARRSCSLELLDPATSMDAVRRDTEGRWRFSYSGSHRLTDLEPGLAGRHQLANAALAIRAVERLAERDGWALRPDAVRRGLRRTRLPGRFERRSRDGRELVLDVAHSPMKLRALTSMLEDVFPGRSLVWVLAMKDDKDFRKALDVVAPRASAVVATEFRIAGRAYPPQCSVPAARLAAAARSSGCPWVRTAKDVSDALEQAADLSPPALPIVVAGSIHLVAAVAEP